MVKKINFCNRPEEYNPVIKFNVYNFKKTNHNDLYE
jgi:hypothetical protein